MQWPHRRNGEVTWRSELLQRLQEVRGNCKTRNQLIITRTDLHYAAVPLSAVVREGDRASVWVAQPAQQFVRRAVTLGLEHNGSVQIRTGVEVGEAVAAE